MSEPTSLHDGMLQTQVKAALKDEPDPVTLTIADLTTIVRTLIVSVDNLTGTIWSVQTKIESLNTGSFIIRKQ